jgi:hypothetical protein
VRNKGDTSIGRGEGVGSRVTNPEGLRPTRLKDTEATAVGLTSVLRLSGWAGQVAQAGDSEPEPV